MLDKAIAVVGQAVGDLTQSCRLQLGTSQERISSANDRTRILVGILNRACVNFLEGVDPYRSLLTVNALLTQIETAYALTGWLQNLSLMKYIFNATFNPGSGTAPCISSTMMRFWDRSPKEAH